MDQPNTAFQDGEAGILLVGALPDQLREVIPVKTPVTPAAWAKDTMKHKQIKENIKYFFDSIIKLLINDRMEN